MLLHKPIYNQKYDNQPSQLQAREIQYNNQPPACTACGGCWEQTAKLVHGLLLQLEAKKKKAKLHTG